MGKGVSIKRNTNRRGVSDWSSFFGKQNFCRRKLIKFLLYFRNKVSENIPSMHIRLHTT